MTKPDCVAVRVIALLLLASASSLHPTPARAQEDSVKGEYDRAVKQGLQEFRLGNFPEMYAAMRRAHQLQPNARTLRGMGVAAFELKNYVQAVLHLRAALTEPRKPLTPQLKAEVERMLKRAEIYVDRVSVEVAPEAAVLRVGGGEPVFDEDGKLLLALGDHELTASLDGHETARKTIHAVGGASHEVRLALRPVSAEEEPAELDPAAQELLHRPAAAPARDDAGASQRTWGYIALGGAGAVAIGAGVAFGLRQSAASDYNSDACKPLRSVQCADEADQVDTMQTLAIAGAVGAGALAITGAILLLTAPDDAAAGEARSGCVPGGPGLLCTARF